jgi:hypothetical protein
MQIRNKEIIKAQMRFVKISVMYANSRYNKLIYAYNANFQFFNFRIKISQIVTKMDFLYV